MLSIGFCDHIDKVPNPTYYSILGMTSVSRYYHLVNVMSLNLPQSDHIKRLTLYKTLNPATTLTLNLNFFSKRLSFL